MFITVKFGWIVLPIAAVVFTLPCQFIFKLRQKAVRAEAGTISGSLAARRQKAEGNRKL
jgi:hypothetical protein